MHAMSKPISGEIKTYQIKVKRPNGGFYIYERSERYENGRMRKMGKDVLLGKILPDDPEGKIIPTRPKKKSSASSRMKNGQRSIRERTTAA